MIKARTTRDNSKSCRYDTEVGGCAQGAGNIGRLQKHGHIYWQIDYAIFFPEISGVEDKAASGVFFILFPEFVQRSEGVSFCGFDFDSLNVVADCDFILCNQKIYFHAGRGIFLTLIFLVFYTFLTLIFVIFYTFLRLIILKIYTFLRLSARKITAPCKSLLNSASKHR